MVVPNGSACRSLRRLAGSSARAISKMAISTAAPGISTCGPTSHAKSGSRRYAAQHEAALPGQHHRQFHVGPARLERGGDFNGDYTYGTGSGIDRAFHQCIGHGSGTIIEVQYTDICNTAEEPASLAGLGCWISIRSDFSGAVITYGHLRTITRFFTYAGKSYPLAKRYMDCPRGGVRQCWAE